MISARRIITGGGTLACALGIGYLMQHRAETLSIPAPVETHEVIVITTIDPLITSGPDALIVVKVPGSF